MQMWCFRKWCQEYKINILTAKIKFSQKPLFRLESYNTQVSKTFGIKLKGLLSSENEQFSELSYFLIPTVLYSHVPAYIRFGIYSFFRNFENFDFDSAYIREYMVNFDAELGVFSAQ